MPVPDIRIVNHHSCVCTSCGIQYVANDGDRGSVIYVQQSDERNIETAVISRRVEYVSEFLEHPGKPRVMRCRVCGAVCFSGWVARADG